MADVFAFAPALAPSEDLPSETTEAEPIVWPSTDDATLLATARRHWAQAVEAESAWRERALDDKRFAAGEQWPATIVADRNRDRRPCLTIDRMGTHLRLVANEDRQGHAGIVVSAVDDVADPETAKMMRGLVRDIEQQSSADIAYTMSCENAVGPGRGFVRVVPVYTDDFSFKQELRILPIRNLFSVYLDPAHIMPDGSDINWAFVVARLAKDDYERQYGRLSADASVWAAEGDTWVSSSEVQVAEYWWREWHPLELALLEDDQVLPVDRVPEEQHARIIKTRTTRIAQVWCAKINGHEVLEKTRWLGQYVPIAQEVGEVTDIEGAVDYQGLTRRLKDPQRMVNFWESSKAEIINLAPRAPWIGAWEQFEGFEQYWDNAHIKNFTRLPYKPIQIAGQVLPPPQRSAVEPPVQAMVQGSAMAADDIKAISGYQDRVDEQGPGISGEAIRRRSMATNTASFHFTDNKRWMIRHVGRILIDAIPHYYDDVRTVRIVGDDEQTRQVLINQRHTNEDGKEVLYDFTVGRYDVRVDGGPSFTTKRQDAVDKLGPIIGAAPQLLQVIGDDYFRSLDVDLAQHMAERMQKTMDPRLLEGEAGAAKIKAVAEQMQQLQQLPQLLEQLQKQQGQLASMMQSVQSLTMDNQQLRLEVQNKEAELRLEKLRLDLDAREKAHEARMDEREQLRKEYEARTKRMQVDETPSNGMGR